jgi:hypothetical protein
VEICEHLPMMAQQMHHLSVVRSMSTREADHERGRYYMHTGYVPNPNIQHPSYGAVISHELMDQRDDLQIPPFVVVGGNSVGPGFLGDGMGAVFGRQQRAHPQPGHGRERDATDAANGGSGSDRERLHPRDARAGRGDHQKVLKKTLDLMTSDQMAAFHVNREPEAVQERYGKTGFGRGCLMARRLVEAGVPFIEVDLGGWDNHQNIFPTLQNQKLPEMDRAMSASGRGPASARVVGGYGPGLDGRIRTHSAHQRNGGRDHWARAWSVVLGGAGLKNGTVVGETNADGTRCETDPYSSQDLMATVCHALGISLETTFTSRSGRPMKIANSGRVIKELFA